MIEKAKIFMVKYKNFILYVVFGMGTTVVNLAAYYLFFVLINLPNVPSTIIAWIFAVAFAFITNKMWVFNSRSFGAKTLKYEIITFFGARVGTGLLDVVIMYLAVDTMNWNSTEWKLISNIIVIILNYVASKCLIFKIRK